MELDRVLTDLESLTDLPVGEPPRHQLQHLELSRCQRFDRRRGIAFDLLGLGRQHQRQVLPRNRHQSDDGRLQRRPQGARVDRSRKQRRRSKAECLPCG